MDEQVKQDKLFSLAMNLKDSFAKATKDLEKDILELVPEAGLFDICAIANIAALSFVDSNVGILAYGAGQNKQAQIDLKSMCIGTDGLPQGLENNLNMTLDEIFSGKGDPAMYERFKREEAPEPKA